MLEGADPARTKVMMYCTGGIRCDIYSAYLKDKGFKNLYTLEGGIANYIRQERGQHWNGSLFVFDGRMAVAKDDMGATALTGAKLPAAVPCQLCGSSDSEAPHVNCANSEPIYMPLETPAARPTHPDLAQLIATSSSSPAGPARIA